LKVRNVCLNLIKVNLFILDCSAPVIELIPSALFLSKPLKFRPNQNIYISSNIEMNCSQSLSIKTKWKIYDCSLISSNQAELNQSMKPTLNDLLISTRILRYGLYKFELIVTMIDYPSLISSSFVYIEITRSIVTINLISFDKLMIIHDYQNNLILNPGEFSFDLNQIPFNKDVCYHFR